MKLQKQKEKSDENLSMKGFGQYLLIRCGGDVSKLNPLHRMIASLTNVLPSTGRGEFPPEMVPKITKR